MDKFEITDEILKLCLYGNLIKDKVSLDGKNIEIYLDSLKDFPSLPLPHQVKIGLSALPGCKYGVFARTVIRTGTEMGPFVGHVKRPCDIQNVSHNPSLWEVFDTTGHLLHFIDGGHYNPASWLSLIQCARSEREQNLEVTQIGANLYFKASKDILCGQELLVWYGMSHSLFMGLPLQNKADRKVIPENSQIPIMTNSKEVISKLKCVLCRRGFNSRSNLRSHMRIHTLEKPFACKYCSRKFSQSSTLRNHVRLHTGEKPYRCSCCNSSYSQLAGLRAHQRSARHRPTVGESN
ncbi:PR domain zinc finger protein 12 [Mytilus coruscus]|uniref:PR domain zinc finger protein 12 n=1 Tax=Mytilus coruscus TaxID=42192 RepID=A0A6J8CK58_MYTCO|nr:PR domain zinc finger protein 12 [Mytilus coruscus]